MLNSILLLFDVGTGELVIIVLVILLLFGGKKIPELMKGIGKGIRSFKTGMNEVEDELSAPLDKKDETKKEEPKKDEPK
jgi:sec-independent protein translocase protein TatA